MYATIVAIVKRMSCLVNKKKTKQKISSAISFAVRCVAKPQQQSIHLCVVVCELFPSSFRFILNYIHLKIAILISDPFYLIGKSVDWEADNKSHKEVVKGR